MIPRFRKWCAPLIGALLLATAGQLRAEEARDLDVRLFGTAQLDGFAGCSFALWQHNRDPATDAYAYVLFQPFGGDGAPQPAWVKIGKQIRELTGTAEGGGHTGGMAHYQVFRDTELTALVDIHDARETADRTEITSAHVTFVQTGALPFRVRTEGAVACPAPDTASPGLVLGEGRDFEGLDTLPRGLMRTVRQETGEICDFDSGPGFGTAYALTDAMTLYQIPCYLAAYQATSVLVAALNENPSHAAVLTFSGPPGEGEDRRDIVSPEIDPATGILTSVSRSRGAGDCGVYERHRLVEAEGESVEFRLIEYREKTQCDGVASDPRSYPLVYSAE